MPENFTDWILENKLSYDKFECLLVSLLDRTKKSAQKNGIP